MPAHPIFAALYDGLFAVSERAGLRKMRAELLADARGRVLELGAGTGLNLEHYGAAVDELVLSEPDPHMARRLRGRVESEPLPFPVEVVEIGATDMPFEPESFDSIVATLVFCTIPDPRAAVRRVAELLVPGGRLLVLEHVRAAEEGSRSRWQDRLERPWGRLAGGCHPNRDTVATLSAAFDVSNLQPARFPGPVPPIVSPMIVGAAQRATE